jgi:hypothetical protein
MILRLCVSAILDNDVHAGTLDEKGALALMTGEAFEAEGEAVGKWKRAQLTSAQLATYFYGFNEMMALRTAREGARIHPARLSRQAVELRSALDAAHQGDHDRRRALSRGAGPLDGFDGAADVMFPVQVLWRRSVQLVLTCSSTGGRC